MSAGRRAVSSGRGGADSRSSSPAPPDGDRQDEHPDWIQFRSNTLDTVQLADGSVVRRLPPTPTDPLRRPSTPIRQVPPQAGPSAEHELRPRPSRDMASPRRLYAAELDDADSVTSGRSPSWVGQRRGSFSSTSPGASTSQLDLASSMIGSAPEAGDPDDFVDEELEARSPLHPAHSATRQMRAGPSRPYLAPISTSPTRFRRRREGSVDVTHAEIPDDAGWVPLTPTRSAEGGAAHGRELIPDRRDHDEERHLTPTSPVGGLTRRNTITAAVERLRRVSDRVVHLQEEDDEADPFSDDRLPTPGGSVRPGSSAALHPSDSSNTLATSASKERDDVSTLQLEDGAMPSGPAPAPEPAYRRLRGKSLGFLGPENRFRRACAAVLTARWTEPAILLLIVLQVVVQTIRSSYDVYTHPRPTKGYFHTWEDVVLFVIFCAFTVEIIARIVVTGLVISPPRPTAPADVAADPYKAPSRTPSIVTKIHSHLTPTRSRTTSRRTASPSPSRSTAGTEREGLGAPSPLESPIHLRPASAARSDRSAFPSAGGPSYPPSPVETKSMEDVFVHDYGGADQPRRVGLGFDGVVTPTEDRAVASLEYALAASPAASPTKRSAPYSVRTGLASALPVATAPAEGNYAASSIHGSTGTGPGPFAYSYAPYALSIKRQRQTYQHAFLRHSFNRLDLVAVLSFWISFVLAATGAEAAHNLWFFRALTVLRATRLLAITAGTQTILHSLKKASPLLVNVGFFTVFAMVLFSIVGVQAFSDSYKRHCVWVDPQGVLANVTSSQNCGGYYVAGQDEAQPWLMAAGHPSPEAPKGYLCGAPSICIETGNPVAGTWSFDNVLAALFQVVVIASANTWTSTMYQMMDADYEVSAIYFIAGILVLNYWMLNLLVAVITGTFAEIREETKHSAFAAESSKRDAQQFRDEEKPLRGLSRTSRLVRLGYQKTHLIWVALILVSISFQANRSFEMSARADRVADWMEFSITLALDVEILIRIFSYLPDWRRFFTGVANRVDLLLAVVTTILLLPGVFETAAYRWLTVFQIARFYRVIMVIPRIRRLLLRVLGTITGLANMVLFLLLMTYIAALVAVEFFRGIPDPNSDNTGYVTFYQIFDSFLAMYQILSSENWTDITNTIMANEKGPVQIVLAGLFLSVWMLFSYFILCNMFIAVINENFAIADEEKRARQIAAFVDRRQASTGEPTIASWFRRFDPYTYATTRSRKNLAAAGPPEDPVDRKLTSSPDALVPEEDAGSVAQPAPRLWQRLKSRTRALLRPFGMEKMVQYLVAPAAAEPHRSMGRHHREVTYDEMSEAVFDASKRQRQQTIANYINANPSYDKTLYLFPQTSRIRQLCQRLVDPCSGGDRIYGKAPNKVAKWTFQAIVLAAIVASIAVAAVATPFYRRQYFLRNGHVLIAWYNLTEVLLGSIFIGEFCVKVIADGFLFAPNAYLLSLANDIDFFVLLTVIINVSTLLLAKTGDDRFTRALKGFRALRLINILPSIRETFYSVLILGASRILDASILAVLYIIPYAVWAANVFRGLLYGCNDTSVSTKDQCVGEYLASPTADWTFLAPRVWSNPTVWSFDTFRSSLLILFEIVSLEGWIDVMESVMNITGRDKQPEEKASQFNAMLLVFYNLIGALFILTIFVSVIIESFVRRSGNSLLTTEQRQWQDLRKLISRQRPAKRPAHPPANPVRAWCYQRAVQKHGWWSRAVTALYVLNIVVLLTQATTTSRAHVLYNWLFLGFVALYTLDVAVRLTGLGFVYFFANVWNGYDLVVIIGVLISTFPILAEVGQSAFIQVQKVFLVALVFKLVQRSDALNQLFKTAIAALPTISNIFALWLILFLTFALFYTEIFGLTRWGPNGTSTANYYSFASTLVLLALQSTGEGWNGFMHDYTMEWPGCTDSPFYLLSDCGSSPWAYTLFIVWNILSMYLFVNLVLGAVVETFSFAFQEYGKVTRITRGDMRGFKRVWSTFDTERTGYLQPRDVPRFLSRLRGVFEVKIYRDEWSVPSLQAASYRSPGEQHNSPAFVHYLDDRDALSLRRVDVDQLRRLVDSIDSREVAVRRQNFILAYHEVISDAEDSLKGISFNKMLLTLAHYRLINDESALQMDELARRRRKRQLIQDRADNDRVRSFLRMVVLRRRFLAHLEGKRVREYGLVPNIHVEEAGPLTP